MNKVLKRYIIAVLVFIGLLLFELLIIRSPFFVDESTAKEVIGRIFLSLYAVFIPAIINRYFEKYRSWRLVSMLLLSFFAVFIVIWTLEETKIIDKFCDLF